MLAEDRTRAEIRARLGCGWKPIANVIYNDKHPSKPRARKPRAPRAPVAPPAPTIRELLEAGKDAAEIVAQLGCKTKSVYDVASKTNRQIKATPEVCDLVLTELRKSPRPAYLDIARPLGISTTTVYHIAHAAGLTKAKKWERREPDRKTLPTCEWCGLLAPCSCTGPRSAVEFLGRNGEARSHMELPR